MRHTFLRHLPGGTFPTQALMRCPPTEIVHDPQSPLKPQRGYININMVRFQDSKNGNDQLPSANQSTHFLQEYLGLTPRDAAADDSGLPGLKFIFLPL